VYRRIIQFSCVVALLFGVGLILIWFVMNMRIIVKNNILAILGGCCLLIFIVIRVASFYHVIYTINISFMGVNVVLVLELLGALLIGVNARILLLKMF